MSAKNHSQSLRIWPFPAAHSFCQVMFSLALFAQGLLMSNRLSRVCSVQLAEDNTSDFCIKLSIMLKGNNSWKPGSTGCIDLPALLHVLSDRSTYLYLDLHLHH